jgi:hypothetical protein
MRASDRTLRLLTALFGVDPQAAARAMAAATIALEMVHPSPADEIALALCATLLLRLDAAAPTIAIDVPRTRARSLPGLSDEPLVDALSAAHSGFDSVARLRAGRMSAADLTITFGAAGSGRTVSSSGWAALVDERPGGPPGNEIGASFAGVLGAGEAFKAALLHAGIRSDRVAPWKGVVSLWDFSLSADPGPPLPASIDLTGHAFAGAGGIATACGWVLGMLPVCGDPAVVDFDVLDETNLNRHLSGGFANVGDGKAGLLADMLASSSCHPVLRESRWENLPAGERSPLVAVVTVDDDATRRDIQLDMPRYVLNAGTSDDGLYRLTAHDFTNGACLGCVSRGDRRFAGIVESVAAALGLEPGDIAAHARSVDPLPPSIIERLAVEPEVRRLLATIPGREFLEAACAHLTLSPAEPAVSAPMLSAAPGVLLAASIVKGSVGRPERGGLDVRTSILSGPHQRWARGLAKRTNCECSDPVYLDHHRQKWTVTPPLAPR